MTVHVNSEGVPKLAAGEWALILRAPGDAWPHMIAFGCPCGKCHDPAQVVHNCYLNISVPGVARVVPGDGHPSWEWDGNWEAPTLTPSIQRRGACNWHGYLRAGKFVEA